MLSSRCANTHELSTLQQKSDKSQSSGRSSSGSSRTTTRRQDRSKRENDPAPRYLVHLTSPGETRAKDVSDASSGKMGTPSHRQNALGIDSGKKMHAGAPVPVKRRASVQAVAAEVIEKASAFRCTKACRKRETAFLRRSIDIGIALAYLLPRALYVKGDHLHGLRAAKLNSHTFAASDRQRLPQVYRNTYVCNLCLLTLVLSFTADLYPGVPSHNVPLSAALLWASSNVDVVRALRRRSLAYILSTAVLLSMFVNLDFAGSDLKVRTPTQMERDESRLCS